MGPIDAEHIRGERVFHAQSHDREPGWNAKQNEPIAGELPDSAECFNEATAFFYTSRRFPPIQIRPESPQRDSRDESQLFEIRIIDNDYNTYQEVMDITMLALGIDAQQAFAVAWEVDHRGYCVVAHAPREEASVIADMIRTIGIEVQVNPISGHGH